VHYFKGGFTPEYIKWGMSWNELMLYMSSIPQFGGGEEAGTEKVETKDASELF
jgi:hypothetical protein